MSIAARIIHDFDRQDYGQKLSQHVDPTTGDIVDTPTHEPTAPDGELDMDELDLSVAALASAHPVDPIAFMRASDTDHDGKLSQSELEAVLATLTEIQRQSLEVKLTHLEAARREFAAAWHDYQGSNVVSRKLKHHRVKSLDERYHAARLDFAAHLLEYAPAGQLGG